MSAASTIRKRAAVFDLDGTLVDSMPQVIQAFVHAVEPFRARPTEAEVLFHLGGPLEECLHSLLGPDLAAHRAAARERLFDYERSHRGELLPFPGVRDLLAGLRDKGIKLGIWTGRDRWSAQRILLEHGLGGFFDATICGDDLPTHKPDPEGLLCVIKMLGVSIDETVFFGDADADIIAGHAIGVHTLFIHHGRSVPEDIRARASEIFAAPEHAYGAASRHFQQKS